MAQDHSILSLALKEVDILALLDLIGYIVDGSLFLFCLFACVFSVFLFFLLILRLL